jgi:hypothetical protein
VDHAGFVQAYRAGNIRIEVDPARAARYVSHRLLLPLVAMPVLGVGVALALVGWLWTGLAVIAIGVVVPRLIKRSAPRFILLQALEDGDFYENATRAGVLRIVPAEPAAR